MPAQAVGLAAAFTSQTGRVSSFDEPAGCGRVTGDDTGESWYFHCTRIADGVRTINPGTWVSFDVVLGPTGLEAVNLRARRT